MTKKQSVALGDDMSSDPKMRQLLKRILVEQHRTNALLARAERQKELARLEEQYAGQGEVVWFDGETVTLFTRTGTCNANAESDNGQGA